MKFLDLQLALFPKGIISKAIDEISVELKKKIPDLSDPFFIPVPEGAPQDIPLLRLTSKDSVFQCTIARGRFDFVFKPKIEDQNKDFSDLKDNFAAYHSSFFSYFLQLIPIKRIGYIGNFFSENKNATEYLKDNFLKKEIGKISELNIRYNEKLEIPGSGIELNSIIKIDPAQLIPTLEDGILIQRDINTVQEVEYPFDMALYESFINYVVDKFSFSEINKILN